MPKKEWFKSEIDELLEKECLTRCELDDLAKLTTVHKNIGYLMAVTGEFTPAIAAEWVSGMKNEDGTKGEHWTMAETTAVRDKLGYTHIPKCQFYAIMNSLYSDYGKTLGKVAGVTAETYGELARDWIDDEDAGPNKAGAYYAFVVDHE